MKTVILAGGLGTRISEQTGVKPKPMIEIGGKPILWHIMKSYSHYGFNDFVICLGYKGWMIRDYFANYALHNSDATYDLRSGTVTVHKGAQEPWSVTLVDTGVMTMTGGRLRRAVQYLDGDRFMLTYGDGVSDIDITQLIRFHESKGALCTVSSVQPVGRFGILDIDRNDFVQSFQEKPAGESGWINAGFFVCERAVLDYIGDDDSIVFEREPLERLARDRQLACYRHDGFWKCMDTLNDLQQLEKLWLSGPAWKVWRE
jgi:glucose-1-phosphate cytidylyltransferase